jgi:nitrogen regulatory protein PII
MEAVKKVEIIVDSLQLKHLRQLLEELSVPGYTVLHDVTGQGDRGERAGDELTDVFRNVYVITAVPEALAQRIVERVRPLLEERGGLCLVSDALSVRH